MVGKKRKYIKPKMKFNSGMQKYEVDLEKAKPEKTKTNRKKKEVKANSGRFSINSPKNRQVRLFFCPRCKSEDVRHFFALKNLFGLIPKWRCRKCNFEGMIFPQLVISKSKLDKLNKKMEKKKK